MDISKTYSSWHNIISMWLMCGTHLTQRSYGMSFHAVWQVGTVFCVVMRLAACGFRTNLCNCWRHPKLNIRITKQNKNMYQMHCLLVVLWWWLEKEL